MKRISTKIKNSLDISEFSFQDKTVNIKFQNTKEEKVTINLDVNNTGRNPTSNSKIKPM